MPEDAQRGEGEDRDESHTMREGLLGLMSSPSHPGGISCRLDQKGAGDEDRSRSGCTSDAAVHKLSRRVKATSKNARKGSLPDGSAPARGLLKPERSARAQNTKTFFQLSMAGAVVAMVLVLLAVLEPPRAR